MNLVADQCRSLLRPYTMICELIIVLARVSSMVLTLCTGHLPTASTSVSRSVRC